MMLVPRSYQDQSCKKAFRYMAEQGANPGNPLIAWPTGTGKAFGISLMITRLLEKWPQMRVMVTAPTEELVEQNYEELKQYWPLAPAGIYCSSLGRFDTQNQIIFGTIDSIDGNQHKFGRIDIMMPDECHRISNKEDSRYHRVYTYFKEKNKFFFMLGWTATDYRMGQGRLTDEGGLFTEVIFDATTLEAFNWFFDEGFLVPPISAPTHETVTMEKTRMTAGDFNAGQLQDQFEADKQSGRIMAALRESVAVAKEEGREHWICFVPGVKACEDVTEMLESMGIPSTFVHSKIKRAERRQRLKDYKAGKYTCMVNNGILTTGFNFKALDFMIMLRKTASASLWIQMLGRGTRPNYAEGFDIQTKEGRLAAIIASGKRNFRVMDFVGNTDRLGPINDPVKPKKPGDKKGNDAPIKVCKMDEEDINGKYGCGNHNHPSLKECFYCNWVFPIPEPEEMKASTAELVRTNKKSDSPIVEPFDVDKVLYSANFKTKKPTIVITYHCGKRKFEEYLCLEHDGYARKFAERMWRDRAINRLDPVPMTISDALIQIDQLRTPRKLLVWTNKKPVEIKGYEY